MSKIFFLVFNFVTHVDMGGTTIQIDIIKLYIMMDYILRNIINYDNE